jgi:hypothetical protein
MIHFCTFGNEPLFSRSVKELCDEAQASGYFDTVTAYNQSIIPEKYSQFVQTNARGYGYWIWKPIVLLERMKNSNEGDIIIYADAGCGISTTDRARLQFKDWIHSIKTHPTHRISFQMRHIEETWTKADVFACMGCTTEQYTKTGQHIACIQLYQNTPENKQFLEEQMKYMCMDNYRYLTDVPSTIPNSNTFIEHRHDQSIVSLLLKKYGSCIYEDHWQDYSHPIVTIRRKYAAA